MKILSTGSLFGDKQKHEQLKKLVPKIKPDILIITGDLFTDDQYSPLSQADDLYDCKEYFNDYKKHCGKVLYIFGESDLRCLEKTFYELLDSEDIICLNDKNYDYEGYTFIGVPYVGNHNHPLKDWVRIDSVAMEEDDDAYVTDEEFNVNKIDNLYEHALNKTSMCDLLDEKFEDALTHKIVVSHFPLYTFAEQGNLEYNYSLGAYVDRIDVLFTGHAENMNPSVSRDKSQSCDVINHGVQKDVLLYSLTEMTAGEVTYNYHPIGGTKCSQK